MNSNNNKTKNAVSSNSTTKGTSSSSQSSKDVVYVDPLPESSRPRKDGPGGN